MLGSWEMPVSEFHSEPLSSRVLYQGNVKVIRLVVTAFGSPGACVNLRLPDWNICLGLQGLGPGDPTWQSLQSLNQEIRPEDAGKQWQG